MKICLVVIFLLTSLSAVASGQDTDLREGAAFLSDGPTSAADRGDNTRDETPA